MKRYIAVIEIDDDEEIVGDANISYTYRSNGTNYGTDESVELKAEDEKQRMKTYEDGLNEAWEAARKITCNDGYNWTELDTIFDSRSFNHIFITNTASEAISKIENYEETKVEIKMGDEVESCGATGVVIESPYCSYYDNEILVLWSNGASVVCKKQDLKKTGRHFSQIAEVLKQMKESEE